MMIYQNANFAVRLSVALCVLSSIASGATFCVSKNPSTSCPFATIGAAVAAASAGDVIQVSRGTFQEQVVIGKAISLISSNNDSVIDATGLANGIYVDGRDNGGLTGVHVSGFEVKNANFEGILVTNASQVTITNNHVLNNNINLNINEASCDDIPPFETAEGFDCGEGIHLSGVDHSVIANNLVENNSGGILLSDDTGATHDNLIIGNTVQNNPLDCGITLASHPLFLGGPTAAGVYHNTITGNLSKHNGYQVPGAGAGVGLFSPAPFTKTYANVVVNNELINNGLPGVSMHAHAPGGVLSDNMIAGNTISGNAADTADTATPGPTGINVSGGDDGSGHPVAVITGTVIAGNVISQEAIGIFVKTNAPVGANLNNFTYPMIGVDNVGGGAVDARQNWWGCPPGPLTLGCASIAGPNILYLPFRDHSSDIFKLP
jgi:parallel beta-helix repeat protein